MARREVTTNLFKTKLTIGGGTGGAGGLKPLQLCKSGKKGGGLSPLAFAAEGEGDYTLNILYIFRYIAF